MEFQKFDFSKLFDVSMIVDNMEKGVVTAIGYLPEAYRKSANTVSEAQFSLIRTTNKALREYAESVESVTKEAHKELTKTIEKATKISA